MKLLYNEQLRAAMSKKPRNNHTLAFGAKVALDALKGEQTLLSCPSVTMFIQLWKSIKYDDIY